MPTSLRIAEEDATINVDARPRAVPEVASSAVTLSIDVHARNVSQGNCSKTIEPGKSHCVIQADDSFMIFELLSLIITMGRTADAPLTGGTVTADIVPLPPSCLLSGVVCCCCCDLLS